MHVCMYVCMKVVKASYTGTQSYLLVHNICIDDSSNHWPIILYDRDWQ